ncbi:ATP-binding protein [Asaccharospora irregularis]|uniref:DNA replication protein DnaC n=1 Tax=Asaccharospora irregularis DSM 2635 TaxID=1121321 RepID=A0A1M5LB32_9FIRM|nr:ATP-binding protein [Asaccharospora irregularis]SHG61623.1 DNA replication protein DnaC [Asaccharospora irregularis DSM 2635]
MNESKIRDILLKYEKRRDNNELCLENRKKEVYERIPEIQNIENKIAKIGLRLTKAVLLDPKSREEIVLKSKDEIAELNLTKSTLLNNYGFPDDYLEMKFTCENCQDKGFLPSGEKCNCLKQEIINEAYKMSNLDKVLSQENFSNFNLDIFSPNKSNNNGISPRENMLNTLSICEKFVFDFDVDNSENLLFYGSTGVGKTYMCNCIAKDLLDKGYVVIYQTSFKILEIIEDYKFRRDDNSKASNENYKNLFECDLLIIDDLGTELNNSFTSGEIFNIVNTRLISGKKIIISTNLSPSQIGKTYTQRTLSRILDKFRVIEFIGNDLRWERFK